VKLKNIWRLYPLGVLIGIFIYFYFVGKSNKMTFYESSIQEKIVDRDDWQKRTVEYYLENGLSIGITVLDSIDLKIGDSIFKEAKTFKFKIYRKSKVDKYEFYKDYELESGKQR
jgi:hypothetical protein